MKRRSGIIMITISVIVTTLIMVLGIVPLPAGAMVAYAANSGTCGDNLTWNLEDEVLTIKGTGTMTPYTSDGINKSPWNGNSHIKEIIIQSGVTSIGDYAFFQCGALKSITIPYGVTLIGDGAFCGCNILTSVSIPKSVRSIGNLAFYRCTSFTNITIPEGVTSIGDEAFSECIEMTEITIPDSLSDIGDGAFCHCDSLASITIPDNVTSINSETFSYCGSLTSITIPHDVTSIGDKAFSYCESLASITIPYGVVYIGEDAFSSCDSLTSITIPDSVTQIGDGALSYCSSLTSITIPDSVTAFGNGIFSYCSSLTSITIPEGATNIDYSAFYECDDLVKITIPKSVTSIKDGAFSNCRSLTDIDVNEDNEKYSSVNGVLYNKNKSKLLAIPKAKLGDYEIPATVTSNYDFVFKDCSLRSISVAEGNGTYSSDDGVLYNKEKTKLLCIPGRKTGDYEIPATVTDGEFYGCRLSSILVSAGNNNYSSYDGVLFDKERTMLVCWPGGKNGNYTIPDEVSIPTGIFEGCTGETNLTVPCALVEASSDYGRFNGVTSITIPEGVTSIGEKAFSGCDSLMSVTIPDSVTSIEEKAFYKCSSLTSVTIPNSVTSIGDEAFYGCSSLKNIEIPVGMTSIGDYAFGHCDTLESITIPNSVKNIGNGAFIKCGQMTSINLSDGATSIGWYTFDHCDNLTDVTIPNGVTSVGMYAFSNCKSLGNLTIPNSVTNIEQKAFLCCTNLSDIYYGGNEDYWRSLIKAHVGIGNLNLINATVHYNGGGEIVEPVTYAVTVIDGLGGGNYAANSLVTVTAKDPPTGKIFDKWTSEDGVTFADANAASTTFTMHTKAVTVKANFKDFETTATPVLSPKEGTFTTAQSITITCATEGAEIHYTTDGTTPTKESAKYTTAIAVAKTTTIKAIAVKNDMHDSAVAKATYTIKEATYSVAVVNGTGDGDYKVGATVGIKAYAAPEGKEFDKWTTGDGVFFADASAASTTFTMPAKPVTVTATYRDIPDPTITPAPTTPVKEEATINEKPVKIEAEFTYPQAVTWTGKKITKEQLGVLADNGQAVKVTITGLTDAITKMKKSTDPTKLYSIVYNISGKDVGSGTFKIKIKLNNKALKKAGIKGDDKKALEELVNKLNDELEKDVHTYTFKVAPIDLDGANKSVGITIKATLKKKKVQVNEENGTIKGLKSVTITYKVPAGKTSKGKQKYKTQKYTYKKSTANSMFVINVTDAKKKIVSITATDTNLKFSGTRTDVVVKK